MLPLRSRPRCLVNSLDMVRVVDCHAGVLGWNPGGPKDFPLGITLLVAVVIW